MSHSHQQSGSRHSKSRGVTVTELLAVLACVTAVSTVAVPSFKTWKESLVYRDTARSIVYMLREARSRAIAINRECRIEFEQGNRRYGFRDGDRPLNTNWADVPPILAWETYPPGVEITANISSVQFNTSGTANGGTITVRNSDGQKRYEIVVNRTGRIRIK